MAGTILPAAQQLLAVHASRLDGGSSRARSAHDTALVGFLLLVLLVGMIGIQVWLYRQSNRFLNPPLVVATALAVILLAVVASDLRSEAAQAGQARDRSYASISALAQARTVAFKANGDESLTLIGRGNGGAFDDDFNAQSAKLGPLLDQARGAAVSSDEGVAVQSAGVALQQYLSVHASIRRLDDGGQFDQAVKLAVGGGTASAANRAFDAFDQQLTSALSASEADFLIHIGSAQHHLRNLSAAIVVVVLVAVLLALWGFQSRIREYR
jgi:hypothetical protein